MHIMLTFSVGNMTKKVILCKILKKIFKAPITALHYLKFGKKIANS